MALPEGISVVGRRGGDVAGVLARVESPLALVAAGGASKDLLLGQLARVTKTDPGAGAAALRS